MSWLRTTKLSWVEIVKRSIHAKNPKLVPEIVASQLENKTSEEKLEICNEELDAPERSELEQNESPPISMQETEQEDKQHQKRQNSKNLFLKY